MARLTTLICSIALLLSLVACSFSPPPQSNRIEFTAGPDGATVVRLKQGDYYMGWQLKSFNQIPASGSSLTHFEATFIATEKIEIVGLFTRSLLPNGTYKHTFQVNKASFSLFPYYIEDRRELSFSFENIEDILKQLNIQSSDDEANMKCMLILSSYTIVYSSSEESNRAEATSIFAP